MHWISGHYYWDRGWPLWRWLFKRSDVKIAQSQLKERSAGWCKVTDSVTVLGSVVVSLDIAHVWFFLQVCVHVSMHMWVCALSTVCCVHTHTAQCMVLFSQGHLSCLSPWHMISGNQVAWVLAPGASHPLWRCWKLKWESGHFQIYATHISFSEWLFECDYGVVQRMQYWIS